MGSIARKKVPHGWQRLLHLFGWQRSSGQGRFRIRRLPRLEWLEGRIAPSIDIPSLPFNGRPVAHVSATLSQPNQVDLYAVTADAGDQLTIDVNAQQFAFSYTYPDAAGRRPVTSDQLYVPKGRQILFRVHAKDVLHDFFVPAFRLKTDAVPGITTTIRVTPDRLGSYPVVCAELCMAWFSWSPVPLTAGKSGT